MRCRIATAVVLILSGIAIAILGQDKKPAFPFVAWTELSCTNIVVGEPVELVGVLSNVTGQTQSIVPPGSQIASAPVVEFRETPTGRVPVVPPLKEDEPIHGGVAAGRVVYLAEDIPAHGAFSDSVRLFLTPNTSKSLQTELRFPSGGLYAIRMTFQPRRGGETNWLVSGEQSHLLRVQQVPRDELVAWQFYNRREVLQFVGSQDTRSVQRCGRHMSTSIPKEVEDVLKQLEVNHPDSRYTKILKEACRRPEAPLGKSIEGSRGSSGKH